MQKEKAVALEESLKGLNFTELSQVAYLIVHKMITQTPNGRRLGCYQLGDITLVYGRGHEWSNDIHKLYQNWFASKLDATPPEFELHRLLVGKIGALFDSFNKQQLQFAIPYLQERLSCLESTSDQAALPTPKLSLSAKPPELKKSESLSPSSEDQASS